MERRGFQKSCSLTMPLFSVGVLPKFCRAFEAVMHRNSCVVSCIDLSEIVAVVVKQTRPPALAFTWSQVTPLELVDSLAAQSTPDTPRPLCKTNLRQMVRSHFLRVKKSGNFFLRGCKLVLGPAPLVRRKIMQTFALLSTNILMRSMSLSGWRNVKGKIFGHKNILGNIPSSKSAQVPAIPSLTST